MAKLNPVIHCAMPDEYQAKLAAMFDLLDKALTLNEKSIEWSNKQINERLDQLQAKNTANEQLKTVPVYLTEQQVQVMLGRGHTTVNNLATDGYLTRIKNQGRGTRYLLEEVEALQKNGYPPRARKEGGRKNVSGN
ncbi:MAG: helix-turn-helix domain-containing protein [Desulfobulbaceae bacterium]|jgi:hypothetical protein|nr:helix-turn-helix domain-containing protein [Desulfobulbaceae bacterium]